MLKSFNLPRAVKILLYALLTLALLNVVLLFFLIDDTPLLKTHQALNREDIQRAKQILNVAPQDRGQLKTISLNQKDLNIAASYLLNHFAENTTQIQFTENRLWVQVAIFVPETLWGRFIDISIKLFVDGDAIKVKSLKIGEISIPDPAANYLAQTLMRSPPLKPYWEVASHYIKRIHIGADSLEISYLGGIIDEAKRLAVQKHREYPHLHNYQQQINEIVKLHDPAWRLSLNDLLSPLFLAAYQQGNEANAIQENRAVIIAVSSYIFKQELRRFLPLGLVFSKEYPVFAYKRIDIPQHFMASALLAMVDNALLGEQLGEDKELGDAENGSGFSFIDLSADRAGTRFGQLAIASPSQARELQRVMSSISDYSAFIPDPLDLPEHLNEANFKLKFGAIGSPEYQQIINAIDQRIDALPLYQKR